MQTKTRVRYNFSTLNIDSSLGQLWFSSIVGEFLNWYDIFELHFGNMYQNFKWVPYESVVSQMGMYWHIRCAADSNMDAHCKIAYISRKYVHI